MEAFVRQWPLAIAYGAACAAALAFTRFDGNVAFLWGATSILTAALLRTSRRRWGVPVAICASVSALCTGLIGLGWPSAVPFAITNMVEAIVAAWLLRRVVNPAEIMRSLGWFVRFVAVVGVIAPLCTTVLAGMSLALVGKFTVGGMFAFFSGHSLGNLTFTPLALMLTGTRARRQTMALFRDKRREGLLIMALVALVAGAIFAQQRFPVLFLPVMAVIFATFRLGRTGAAVAIVLLATVGGGLTALGSGPIMLIADQDLGSRMQFFQFYLAATVLTVLPVSADLHGRRRLLKRVRLSEERFRLMAEHSSDLLLHIAADGRFLYVSPSIRQISGYDPEQLVGTASSALIAPEHLEFVRQQHWSTLEMPGATSRFQYEGVMADGSRRWFEAHSRALVDEEGEFDGVLSMARDITENRAREQQLATAAMTDTLTGLPNRRALLSRVAERGMSARTGDCLAILDIDYFKQVNDIHGHQVGDEVLKGFAAVVRGQLRTGDIPARLGGEEFVILFPDTSPEQALQICDRLRERVAAGPIPTSRGPIRITVSGGVAAIGRDGAEVALRTADRALYKAKQCGRDQFRLAA